VSHAELQNVSGTSGLVLACLPPGQCEHHFIPGPGRASSRSCGTETLPANRSARDWPRSSAAACRSCRESWLELSERVATSLVGTALFGMVGELFECVPHLIEPNFVCISHREPSFRFACPCAWLYAINRPASFMPCARAPAKRCSTTKAFPNHSVSGWTCSSIHSLPREVRAQNKKTVPSLRTCALVPASGHSATAFPLASASRFSDSLAISCLSIFIGAGFGGSGAMPYSASRS
jgi:hypothetical protein